MSVITHRLNDGTDKALCGEKLSCVPGADVWHILLTSQDFNNDEITQGTRCADCAEIQDARENGKRSAKIALNLLYGKAQSTMPEVVHKADLVAAFNIVEERDKEIATLRQDILHLEKKLKRTEDSLDGAVNAGAEMINKINDLSRENVRLENKLHFAEAEAAPLARQAQRLAKSRDILVDALNAVDNTVKNARETLNELDK